MALSELPNSYSDVTGVVDSTAASEVAALIDQLAALLPDPENQDGSAASPDFDAMRPEMAVNLRAEITAMKAAIAAAPTA